jgi:proline iminopeptidase
VLAEIQKMEATKDTQNPRYMQLLMAHHYEKHVLRRPEAEWPDPALRGLEHINPAVYVPMQGPSELGASGLLETWDRVADLPKIGMPTLVIGAAHDTMDPIHMERMAKVLPRGRYLFLPDGSHMSMYDDQQRWVAGIVKFLRDVDAGTFGP